MTDTAAAAKILGDLDAALRGPLGVRRVTTADELKAPGPYSRYLRDTRLTLALHFELAARFLILDPLLGTLGIVELVPDCGGDVDTQVRRAVDRATYTRHLLLRDRGRGTRRPLTVELVFVTGGALGGEGTLDTIGVALRKIVQDTDSLFHVGIGVLSHDGSTDPFGGRLRRAFPWLLTATRLWLSSPRANRDAPAPAGERVPPPVRTLRRLRLVNYRLPGTRDITLSSGRIHLVHGPNGSGKSSIAEALEIVTCGTVKRLSLAGDVDYKAVIGNTPADPTTVQLSWSGAENQIEEDPIRTIGKQGLEQPLNDKIDAGSFRLDQPLMDRLVGQTGPGRAKIFVDAFFPEAVDTRIRYEAAAAAHASQLAAIDREIERLTAARKALADLQGLQAGTTTQTSEAFHTVLNKWLEQTALLDLLSRQRIVSATLAAARATGWKAFDPASDTLVGALTGTTDPATLEQFEQARIGEVNELESKLASFTAPSTPSPGQTALIPPATVEILNAVGPLLFDSTVVSSSPFGAKVANVFDRSHPGTYGPIVIGRTGWADTVLKDIDALIAAYRAARTVDQPMPAWPGKLPSDAFEAAVKTRDGLRAAGEELQAKFLDKLRPNAGVTGEFDGSLIAAVNEVIALFTPARWAYADIELPTGTESGTVSMGMYLKPRDPAQPAPTDSAVRAELHLNTAELNLFTVALFLLCIGRVPKPLNLLVFDDPLQNMDELTATALARGLAKIVRLWASLGRSEQLLLLFHGYNDVDRFSAEVAASCYRLPWLSPSVTPAAVPPVMPDGLEQDDVLAIQQIDSLSPAIRA